ncbi:type II toxin-antitoxin system RelE family toxin [Halochromatium salexigens]|uniref:Addiction module toxin RelE n=1 Tax=Halochromatium salexigens TaxID=49447 RepID=A0AAJ0UEC7_HALSE|nr:type II toxin-antitoxin system RelE/ParE family toxin [Halochromatium salexigens]MBK5929753.1 addiction module toxin RelE [Halochromatium salexigens]
MTWTIEWDERARRELRRLDPSVQREILAFLRQRIAVDENPRRYGKALRHALQGLWRYRIRDHRVVCRIQDDRVVVLVLKVGHRSKVYG